MVPNHTSDNRPPGVPAVSRRTALSMIAGAGVAGATSQRGNAQSATTSNDIGTAWYRPLNGSPTWPVAHDGVAYVADSDGNIFGYDASSGESQFKQSVDGSITAYGLTVADSILAVTLQSGSVRFFDLATQEPVGRFPIGAQPAGMTSFGQYLYVVDTNATLKKFDASGPEPLWQEDLGYGRARNPQTPLAGENGLVITQSGGRLLFVDPTDGTVLEEITQTAVYQGAFGQWTGTISNNSTACVVERNSNAAYIFDLQAGTTRQLQYTGSGISSCGPAAGLFFIGDSEGINAMRETTGEIEWQLNFEATKLSFDVFGTELVVIGRDSGDGYIRSRDIETQAFEWEVPLSEPENLLSGGVGGYSFTKPIQVGDHYIVGGSSNDGNWIASFGPQQAESSISNESSDSSAGSGGTEQPGTADPSLPKNQNSTPTPGTGSGPLTWLFNLTPWSKLGTIASRLGSIILVWYHVFRDEE
ncbi:hypothetical protein GCM10027355_32680 [Haloplanus salinarum]